MVAGAVWLQLGRRGEQLLLRSLGIGPFGVALPAMAVASIGEIVIAVLIR